jgi:2-hydroxychromene-2-carboxylate isomerase
VHVAEGEADIWDRPADDTGLLALQAGVAVRDLEPDKFLAVHHALFALRHDEGGKLDDENALRRVLEGADVDGDAVFERIRSGATLETVRLEHTEAAKQHTVWGVPTFVSGDRAIFVRLMDRPAGDAQRAIDTIERVLDLVEGWPELNEFKATSIPR